MGSNYPHLSSMTWGDNWKRVINQLYLTSILHLECSCVKVLFHAFSWALCVKRWVLAFFSTYSEAKFRS